MVEKRRVRFANTAGKPLVTVREINAVGRGTKLTPLVRKFTPADLKKLKAKHQIAEKRAMANLSKAKNNLKQKKEVAANIRKIQIQAKLQLTKAKTPGAVKNLKEKINKMNGHMKTIAPHIENSQLAVNIAKNKLKAQRELGMKRSRFGGFM